MSSTDRQNNLLINQDWKKIYQSFRNADFQSYDFENLRRTMIEYLRTNYPEDFNDYIESSEYLALIDLIAFLGQSIAFRVDLNARENFLELAERRDSVLRLARLISYNAKRNIAGQGLLKFNTIQTSETVVDSNGRNLAGQVITWNDPSNTNWNDQFIKVMNAAFPASQQFGNPSARATIYGIPTGQYRFSGNNTDLPIYSFTKMVSGRQMNFEITSTTFSGQSFVYEEPPKIGNSPACIYREDGHGAGSAGTGFFFNFTEGTLNVGSFVIDQPTSNESIDVDAQNINNNDVWLYRLDQNGLETELWTQVSSVTGNNIIYNSINKNIKNIYSVLTRAGDAVSLSFSDGTFGNLPLGTFRTYYRVSNGLNYTINPADIRNVSITIPYTSVSGSPETITISLNLVTSVSNATLSETNTDVKTNAPQTYYTQNRMITGEDYNISPLSVTQEVAKVKAINRASSGISRYFDLADPTGKYSSTNLFADDGILYQNSYTFDTRFSYATRTDIEGVIYNTIFPILKKPNLRNFYYSNYTKILNPSLTFSWFNISSDSSSSTGYLGASTSSPYKVGTGATNDLVYLVPQSLVRFSAPVGYFFDTNKNNKITASTTTNYGKIDAVNLVVGQTYTIYSNAGTTPPLTNFIKLGASSNTVGTVFTATAAGTGNGVATLTVTQIPTGGASYIWAEVVSVTGDGTAVAPQGGILLNRVIPSAAVVSRIIPKLSTSIDPTLITTIIDLVFANKPFGLRYDIILQAWQIVFESNLDTANNFSLINQGNTSNLGLDSSWVLLFTTDNEFYTVTTRQLQYVFESDSQVRFYFDSSEKIYDVTSNTVVSDKINILSVNTQPGYIASAFTYDLAWDVVSEINGVDGYVDNKKIAISFADSDSNGIVDNPQLFLDIVDPVTSPLTKYIVQEKYSVSIGQEDYRYMDNSDGTVIIRQTESSVGSYTQYNDGQYFYFVTTNVVKKLNLKSGQLIPNLDYKVFIGRDKLKFQYTHSADYESRIDPGVSNIIDIYVLTKNYDTQFRQWLNGSGTSEPLPPGSDELYNTIAPSLNLIKSISDEIIYHPVNYRILFGATADSNLQAIFKITKNANSVVSDNDIKARTISAINQFFSLDNWDFGDTFYFSELSTYIMTQLAPDVTNFIIVPRESGVYFGGLFEIKCPSNQLFINGATVDDIEIISGITSGNIKSVTGSALSTAASTQVITSSSFGASN